MVDALVQEFDEPALKRRKMEQDGNLLWALVRPVMAEANLKKLRKTLITWETGRWFLDRDYRSIRAKEAFFGDGICDASAEWREWHNDEERCYRLQEEARELWERDTNYMLVQKNLVQQ